MAEQRGYLYRRTGVTAEQLRALVGRPARGWAWSHAALVELAADPGWPELDEGRACYPALELRWRREPAGFDVLALALAPQQLDGFTAYAGDTAWQTATTACLTPVLPGARGDTTLSATTFSTPTGIARFVALTAPGAEA